jgi:NADH-quinone oxidoreductase subunit A
LLSDFGYIGLLLIASILLASGMVLAPVVLRLIGLVPRKSTKTKTSNFECGMQTIGKTLIRFNFRYYFYALMFVALDILVILLYPWAAGLRTLGYFGLVVVLIFIFLVIIGYIYAWKKKVLEWK